MQVVRSFLPWFVIVWFLGLELWARSNRFGLRQTQETLANHSWETQTEGGVFGLGVQGLLEGCSNLLAPEAPSSLPMSVACSQDWSPVPNTTHRGHAAQLCERLFLSVSDLCLSVLQVV